MQSGQSKYQSAMIFNKEANVVKGFQHGKSLAFWHQ
jgi:hypothetical protein